MDIRKKDKKILLSVILVSLGFLIFVNNAYAVAYLHPTSYDLPMGTRIDGSVYSLFQASDSNTLDIQWRRTIGWFKYNYDIKIIFNMEIHRYYTISFVDWDNMEYPTYYYREITVYYTDGTNAKFSIISILHSYEITVNSNKYVDYIELYAHHVTSIFSPFNHYSYFDFVGAVFV